MKKVKDRNGKILKVGNAVHVVEGVNSGRHGIIDGFTANFVRLTWTYPSEWEGKRGRATSEFCIWEREARRPPIPPPDWRAFVDVMSDQRILEEFAERVEDISNGSPPLGVMESVHRAVAEVRTEIYGDDDSETS